MPPVDEGRTVNMRAARHFFVLLLVCFLWFFFRCLFGTKKIVQEHPHKHSCTTSSSEQHQGWQLTYYLLKLVVVSSITLKLLKEKYQYLVLAGGACDAYDKRMSVRNFFEEDQWKSFSTRPRKNVLLAVVENWEYLDS